MIAASMAVVDARKEIAAIAERMRAIAGGCSAVSSAMVLKWAREIEVALKRDSGQ